MWHAVHSRASYGQKMHKIFYEFISEDFKHSCKYCTNIIVCIFTFFMILTQKKSYIKKLKKLILKKIYT